MLLPIRFSASHESGCKGHNREQPASTGADDTASRGSGGAKGKVSFGRKRQIASRRFREMVCVLEMRKISLLCVFVFVMVVGPTSTENQNEGK